MNKTNHNPAFEKYHNALDEAVNNAAKERNITYRDIIGAVEGLIHEYRSIPCIGIDHSLRSDIGMAFMMKNLDNIDHEDMREPETINMYEQYIKRIMDSMKEKYGEDADPQDCVWRID